VTIKVVKAPRKDIAISLFKPSWSGQTAVTLNDKGQDVTEHDCFIVFDGRLRSGDTLVYTFPQQPYFAGTHNKNTIVGYQKIYQGPLVLAAEVKKNKESFLPTESKFTWDADKNRAKSKDGQITVSPITDVIDWNYSRGSYIRQILWKAENCPVVTR
jgi:DUF1680 family protein